jgi:hypothetical protein
MIFGNVKFFNKNVWMPKFKEITKEGKKLVSLEWGDLSKELLIFLLKFHKLFYLLP